MKPKRREAKVWEMSFDGDGAAGGQTENPLPQTELTMTLLMTPDKANFSGKVHGGAVLKHLDEVAYACASRYCGNYVVTVSVDQVVFKASILVGELVTFLAAINYTGQTSMEVGIRVVTESVQTRSTRHAMTCYFTMVSVDEEGKPKAVPRFVPQTPMQRQREAAARARRELRAEVARRYAEIKKSMS